ncbi:MAG: DUF4199 domain-containing protein [Vicingaceae bacterium]
MKNKKIEVKWAIVFTLITLLWMMFEKSMGWHDELIAKHALYTNWFAPLAILIFIVALKDKRKNYFMGEMRWLDGFKSGVLISIFVAILSPLSQYIVHEFITPNYFENIISFTVEKGEMTQEQAEDYFSFKSYIFQSAIGALVMGVITSAIVALFLKTKKTKAVDTQ